MDRREEEGRGREGGEEERKRGEISDWRRLSFACWKNLFGK